MPIWKGLINYEVHVYTCIIKESQSWLGTETLAVGTSLLILILPPPNYWVSSFDLYLICKNIMGIYRNR